MTFHKLLKRIQAANDWPRDEANRAIKLVMTSIVEALMEGDEVPLPPIGTFYSVRLCEGKMYFNPQTRERLPREPSHKLRFRAYRKFQVELNKTLELLEDTSQEGMTEEHLEELERSLLEC